MSRTEAEKRAQEKYARKLKYLQLKFTQEELDFLERVKEKAKANGGLNAYIKDLLRADLDKGE